MSLAFEQGLISKLTNLDSLQAIWDLGLREEVFEDPMHRATFKIAIDYWHTNGMKLAPTEAVLLHEFSSLNLAPVEESTRWLVEQLQKRFSANQTQQILLEAGERAVSDPQAALDIMFRRSWTASQVTNARGNRMDLATNVEERRARYVQREQNLRTGVLLGLPEVDEKTRGLLPGELGLVAAYSKVGKSWTLCQAAVNAIRTGIKPLFVTLEMSPEEMEVRIDAVFSGVSYNRLNAGRLHLDESDRLRAAQEEMAALGSFYLERPERGERTITHLANRARQLGCGLLLIDQLSFLESPGRYQSVGEQHSAIVFETKNEITRDEAGQIPCLMAVQLNRDSVKANKPPQLHNMANTSDLERTADMIFALHRGEEERVNNAMKFAILGNRRGDIGSWLLQWQLDERTQFSVLRPDDD